MTIYTPLRQVDAPPSPSGFTDAEIARSVASAFSWTSASARSPIKALVVDGQVTLLGEVDWLYQKKAVQDSVCFLAGVTGVNNRLAIRPRHTLSLMPAASGPSLRRR